MIITPDDNLMPNVFFGSEPAVLLARINNKCACIKLCSQWI